MPAVFPLESLYDLIKVQIETDFKGLVLVDWGQNRLPVNLNLGTVGRVLVVPGGPDGDFGEVRDVTTQWPHPARALYVLHQVFSVYVYAKDPQAQLQEDQRHDHIALLALHETLRAIHLATHKWVAKDAPPRSHTSPVKIGKPRLLKPMSQSILGREFLVPCETQVPILDMFDSDLLTHLVFPTAVITDGTGSYSATSTTAEAP